MPSSGKSIESTCTRNSKKKRPILMAVEKWSTFVQNFVNIAIGYYFNDDSYI